MKTSPRWRDTLNLRERIAAHKGEIVLRVTEDYEYQFWLTPFTSAADLEAWWVSQEYVDCFRGGAWDEIWEAMGEELLPERAFKAPGEFLEEQWSKDDDLWGELDARKKHYRAFICCDSDSYLQRPDGNRVYHRGSCNPERRDAAV